MKRSLLVVLLCAALFSPALYADRYDALDIRGISAASSYAKAAAAVRDYVPYIEALGDEWRYPVPKKKASAAISSLLKKTRSVSRRQPGNVDAALLCALLDSYRCKLGELSFGSVCKEFDALREAFADEYRVAWFYGMFLYGQGHISEAVRQFLACQPLEQDESVPADYLADKGYLMQSCGCIKNAFQLYERSAARQQKLPDEIFPLYSLKKNIQMPPSALDGEYDARHTWLFSRADREHFFVLSYIAAYSATIPGSWSYLNVNDIGYKDKMVSVELYPPVIFAKDGRHAWCRILTVTQYFPMPSGWQHGKLEWVESRMEINGRTWTRYDAVAAEPYAEQGGFHGTILMLERPAPGDGWSVIDRPFADMDNNTSQCIVQDRIDAPHTIAVMLDCPLCIYEEASALLMDYVGSMNVQ